MHFYRIELFEYSMTVLVYSTLDPKILEDH